MCCHFIQACCYSCSYSKGWFYSLLPSLLVAWAMFTIVLAVIKQSWRENRLETWHMVRKPTVVSVSLRSERLLAGCLEVAGLPQAACQLPCYCQAFCRNASKPLVWTPSLREQQCGVDGRRMCAYTTTKNPLVLPLSFLPHLIVLFSCYHSPSSLFSWTDTRLD